MNNITTYKCQTPIGQTVLLDMNQILSDRTYRSCWPKSTSDLVLVVGTMIQRVCDRCDTHYHPFMGSIHGMFIQASRLQTGTATPRCIAGNFVVLNHLFNSLDDVISEDAVETILEGVSELVEQYVRAVVQINKHNLHGAIAARRRTKS